MGERLLTEEERAAYFAQPPPKMPNSTIGWVVLGCVILSIGGLLVDHFVTIPAATVNVPSVAPPTPRLHTDRPLPPIPGGVSSIMGLTPSHRLAPGFELETPNGLRLGLSTFRHRTVLLTFFDSACDDICSVVAEELGVAERLLRHDGLLGRVRLVTVNSDPLATRTGQAARASRVMRGVSNWVFLTGTLRQLNRVWKEYGLTVEAQPATGTVSHSEVMYFVSGDGRLVARATPFANEVGRRYELDSRTLDEFGRGIARELERVVRSR